jgi:hypothetical protein
MVGLVGVLAGLVYEVYMQLNSCHFIGSNLYVSGSNHIMETLKKHKKEIIISLITGVFLFYVQPILSFLGDVFVRTFIWVSDKFSNDYYSKIARNDSNAFSDSNNLLLIFLIIGMVFYSIIYIRNKKNELKKRIEKTLRDIINNKSNLQNEEIKEKKSKEDILKELGVLEEEATQIRESLFRRDNRLLSIYILSFFMVIVLFTNYAITKAVDGENVDFRNTLIRIAPFVDESEINKIKADWVKMKNKTDYSVIIKKIEGIKRINKLE